MGWAAYVYIRIHSNNQKELDDYIKSDFEFLPVDFINKAMRYDTYIHLSIWIPRSVLINECDDIVRKYNSFVIYADWHEELNPDHGYYLIDWPNDDVGPREIVFDGTSAEERGDFNKRSKTLKNVYHTIDYDITLKNKIYKTLNLDTKHVGVYSYIWITLKTPHPYMIYEILGVPEECIRWHFNDMFDSQLLVWTPRPLREMINEKISDIVCEWWSADGKKGGVWVKKPKTEWKQSEEINEYIDIEYPAPYTPSFGKGGLSIDTKDITLRRLGIKPSP